MHGSLRILIVQNRYYPAFGGGETHTWLLAKHLSARGHEIAVYTSTSLSKDDILSFSLSPPFVARPTKRVSLSKKEVLADVCVERFDTKWRFWSFNRIPDLRRELKRTVQDFDVIHGHGYHISTSWAACHYAREFNKPFVLTAHDLLIPRNLPHDARVLKALYDATIGKNLLTHSNALIALTEDHVAQYVQRGGREAKISVIPNGIELTKYGVVKRDDTVLGKYGIEKGTEVLLFVGRIEEHKGIQDVITILQDVLTVFPKVRFVVVGEDYGYREPLQQLIRAENLENEVILTGRISEEELLQFYSVATIFVFPSAMEGFGIVLLEAMASATLCIAYAIPGVRRIIRDGENGVLVNNKSELLRSIVYYLNNRDQKADIERNALEYVTRYDMKNIVNATERVYERAISNEDMSGR